MTNPILDIDRLTITFSGHRRDAPAVSDLSLQVHKGEALGLVGESGSGKSLTALAALGLVPKSAKTDGRISLNGVDVRSADHATLRKLRGKGGAMIFQNPMVALNPFFTIGYQMADVISLHQGTRQKDSLERARDSLEVVHMGDAGTQLKKFPHQLSGGQLQRVMIAMALACEPALLIADEPTTALDVTIQREIVDLMKELFEGSNRGLLFISHDLAVVAALCTRIAVLQHGKLVEAGPTQDLLRNPQDDYTKRLLAAVPRFAGGTWVARDAGSDAAAIIEARNLTITYPSPKGPVEAVKNVSFSLAKGESLAIVGESGSGKTTIAMALLGLTPFSKGKLEVQGQDVTTLSSAARREIQKKIGVVFQNPYSSLNPRMKVGAILAEPMHVHLGMSKPEIERRVAELLNAVDLSPEHRHRYPNAFSGGQRQRIAIARALALDPELLVLDEPTAALDVSIQAQVLDLLKSLRAEKGLSYIFITHDLAIVEEIADRVLVLYRGEIVEEGPAGSVLRSPQDPYTKRLIEAVPRLEAVG